MTGMATGQRRRREIPGQRRLDGRLMVLAVKANEFLSAMEEVGLGARGPMKNRLRWLRKEKGLTLKEVGEAVGLDLSTIAKVENGAHCRDSTKQKLAEFYGLSIGDIWLFDTVGESA